MGKTLSKLLEQSSQEFDLEDDTFERAGRVHDWRNHIAKGIKSVWCELTKRERLLLALSAQRPADNEEWD